MNGYDWVIIVILVVAALLGTWKGAVTMALIFVGLFVSMLLSAQFAGPLVRTFTSSVDSEAVATAIGYVAIFVLVFVALGFVGGFIRTALTVSMLGWTDKLGGIAVGVVVGIMLSLSVTAVTARYAYVFENLEGGGVVDRVQEFLIQGGRDRTDELLTESELVPVLIDIRNVIPAKALGLVPGDFNTAMDTLEDRID